MFFTIAQLNKMVANKSTALTKDQAVIWSIMQSKLVYFGEPSLDAIEQYKLALTAELERLEGGENKIISMTPAEVATVKEALKLFENLK